MFVITNFQNTHHHLITLLVPLVYRSCSKEISAFDAASAAFKGAGVAVVGVRNEAGVKDTDAGIKLVVDSADAMREEIGIEKDLFGLLGGRETFVLDSSGTVVSVHNNQ